MVGLAQERVLLIADRDRHIAGALQQVIPAAHITSVTSVFDGVAELAGGTYTTVLAAAAPIERRPEAAVKTLRELAGDGRLLLFGHPTLEPLTRKMLDFGADDYLVTPVTPVELQQMFGKPHLRLSQGTNDAANGQQTPLAPVGKVSLLLGLPLADILLDALINEPADARGAALRQINSRIAPSLRLQFLAEEQAVPPALADTTALTQAVRSGTQSAGKLHLSLPKTDDPSAARHVLSEIAGLFGKLGSVQDTHRNLQRMVMTDELTGLYNGRYFKHFLAKICEKALKMHFGITLLLFDIDNFKKYNDQHGHGVGDEILRQTATIMRDCCRKHDVVARISGDEFAVVFWDKEGPRQPRDANEERPALPARPPQAPEQVFERFRRRIASPEFAVLGATGQGVLTISGGLAAFPWEARTPQELIELADHRLMFGAKKSGKDALFLVGGEEALQNKAPVG